MPKLKEGRRYVAPMVRKTRKELEALFGHPEERKNQEHPLWSIDDVMEQAKANADVTIVTKCFESEGN